MNVYIYIYIYIYVYACLYNIYTVSDNCSDGVHGHIERTKLGRKILYYFAILAIVNKILIAKNCRKLIFNNFLFKYYQLYRKTARDKNCLFFSHRTLRIFSEFFINFLVLNFFIFINIRKYGIKKFLKLYEKKINIFVSCSFSIV